MSNAKLTIWHFLVPSCCQMTFLFKYSLDLGLIIWVQPHYEYKRNSGIGFAAGFTIRTELVCCFKLLPVAFPCNFTVPETAIHMVIIYVPAFKLPVQKLFSLQSVVDSNIATSHHGVHYEFSQWWQSTIRREVMWENGWKLWSCLSWI